MFCTTSPDIIRVIKSQRLRWVEHTARIEERRVIYRVLVGKPEGRRPLGRPRRRWENNIKMNLRDAGWKGIDWIDLARVRDRWRAVVNILMNFLGSIKCWEFLE